MPFNKKSDAANGCHISENCQGENSCHAHRLWSRVDEHLQQYLRTVTLESILEESKTASAAYAPEADETAVIPAFAEDMARRHESVQSPAVA